MLSLQIVNVFSVFVSGITFGLVPVLVNIPEKFIDYIKTFSGGIILALTYKNRCRLKLKNENRKRKNQNEKAVHGKIGGNVHK